MSSSRWRCRKNSGQFDPRSTRRRRLLTLSLLHPDRPIRDRYNLINDLCPTVRGTKATKSLRMPVVAAAAARSVTGRDALGTAAGMSIASRWQPDPLDLLTLSNAAPPRAAAGWPRRRLGRSVVRVSPARWTVGAEQRSKMWPTNHYAGPRSGGSESSAERRTRSPWKPSSRSGAARDSVVRLSALATTPIRSIVRAVWSLMSSHCFCRTSTRPKRWRRSSGAHPAQGRTGAQETSRRSTICRSGNMAHDRALDWISTERPARPRRSDAAAPAA